MLTFQGVVINTRATRCGIKTPAICLHNVRIYEFHMIPRRNCDELSFNSILAWKWAIKFSSGPV
jgi:hypothetical protein